ncbi:MAG: DUF481 domain-containing protein, partial [Roseicyclus sp.]|nr:DUF481 domain-containing protein [Roseicyclus sp.]
MKTIGLAALTTKRIFTLGYKRQLVKTEIHDLSFTSGFGYRYSALINGESVDEAIIRLAGSYSWQIS